MGIDKIMFGVVENMQYILGRYSIYFDLREFPNHQLLLSMYISGFDILSKFALMMICSCYLRKWQNMLPHDLFSYQVNIWFPIYRHITPRLLEIKQTKKNQPNSDTIGCPPPHPALILKHHYQQFPPERNSLSFLIYHFKIQTNWLITLDLCLECDQLSICYSPCVFVFFYLFIFLPVTFCCQRVGSFGLVMPDGSISVWKMTLSQDFYEAMR